MKLIPVTALLLLVSLAHAQQNYLLVGTYTGGKSEGIYVYDFNSSTGDAVYKSKIKASNPSFVAVSPNQKYVYAAFEQGAKQGGGKIAAYSFDKATGQLRFLDEQSSGGDGPCFVDVDKTGKYVAAANYGSGSMEILPIEADGGLGKPSSFFQHTGSSVNKERQEKAHTHSSFFSPDDKYVLTPDLGMDKVMIYAFDNKTGKASAANPAFVKAVDGSGPRHLAFTPNGKYAYLMQEMSGKVVVYSYHNGKLDPIQEISAAQPGFTAFMGSADIHTSSDGKFLYCSNRGEANTITIFSINAATGKLSVLGYQPVLGKGPRNFTIDPSGNFLLVANQTTNQVIVFKRNKTTGMLTDTGKKIDLDTPVCLKWISK